MTNIVSCFGDNYFVASVRERLKEKNYPNGVLYLVKAEVDNGHKAGDLYGLDYALETIEHEGNPVIILCSRHDREHFEKHPNESVREKFRKIMAHKRCRFMDLRRIVNTREIAVAYGELSQKS